MVFQSGIKRASLLLCGILIFTLLSCTNENGDDLQYEEQVPTASEEYVHYAENAASARHIMIQSESFRIDTRVLRLSNMNLTDEDIVVLAEFTNLHELVLQNNQISDLRPLSESTNLRRLFLSGNQISDLAPLSELTYLKFLSLGNNPISDLSPLAKLTNLEYLYLGGRNQISDLSALSGLTNLNRLSFSGRQISDWSSVSHLRLLIGWEAEEPEISELNETQQVLFEKSRYAGMTYGELEELYGRMLFVSGFEGGPFEYSIEELKEELLFWFNIPFMDDGKISSGACIGIRIRLGALLPDLEAPLSWWQFAEKLGARSSVIYNYCEYYRVFLDGYSFIAHIEWIPEFMRIKYPDCEWWKNRQATSVRKNIRGNLDELCMDAWITVFFGHSSR